MWLMATKMPIQTENTGKIFERSVCLLYGIPYVGKYKYDIETAQKLVPRLERLKTLFPECRHSAKSGARYDFTSLDDSQFLSAKTTKKDGKVAPQVIGQAKPEKFCQLSGLQFTEVSKLKSDIQENIINVLPILFKYTFDCPIIYYNENKDTIKFIKSTREIPWSEYQYQWTKKPEDWNGSSTVKIGTVPIAEFQFHSKSRTNMAIRWCFENFLEVFSDYLDVKLL